MFKTIVLSDTVTAYEQHQNVSALFKGAPHVWSQVGETVTIISAEEPTGSLLFGDVVGTVEQEIKVGATMIAVMHLNIPTHHRDVPKFRPRSTESAKQWVLNKLGESGFEVRSVTVSDSCAYPVGKPDHPLVLSVHDAVVVVRITDADLAIASILKGFGRSLRFGCGTMLFR